MKLYNDNFNCNMMEDYVICSDFSNFTGDVDRRDMLFSLTLGTNSGQSSNIVTARFKLRCYFKDSEIPTIEEVIDKCYPLDNNSHYSSKDHAEQLVARLSLIFGIRLKIGSKPCVWLKIAGSDEWNISDPLQFYREAYGAYHMRNRLIINTVCSSDIDDPEAKNFLKPSVSLNDCESYLEIFSRITDEQRSAITQASILYAEALWDAEDNPDIAWVKLVSAIEVAATGGRDNRTRKEEIFTSFISKNYCPSYCLKCNQKRGRVIADSELESILKTIYNYRSRYLHNGRSFPHRMNDSPWRKVNGILKLNERPEPNSSYDIRAGIKFETGDNPLFLWKFEEIVQESLKKWWRDIS